MKQSVKQTQKTINLVFYDKGLKNDDVIVFHADKNICATVVGEREVEYSGEIYKLSSLTYKLYDEMGRLNRCGAYQGSAHFEFKGTLLKKLPNRK